MFRNTLWTSETKGSGVRCRPYFVVGAKDFGNLSLHTGAGSLKKVSAISPKASYNWVC